MRIREQNYRSRRAEVDLIGEQDGTIIFFEVKYRRSGVSGSPESAVTPAKQKRICGCALRYLYEKGLGTDQAVRFDVISMRKEGIRWIKDAFPFTFGGRNSRVW